MGAATALRNGERDKLGGYAASATGVVPGLVGIWGVVLGCFRDDARRVRRSLVMPAANSARAPFRLKKEDFDRSEDRTVKVLSPTLTGSRDADRGRAWLRNAMIALAIPQPHDPSTPPVHVRSKLAIASTAS